MERKWRRADIRATNAIPILHIHQATLRSSEEELWLALKTYFIPIRVYNQHDIAAAVSEERRHIGAEHGILSVSNSLHPFLRQPHLRW